MILPESLSIADHEGEIAASTSSWHFPGKDILHQTILLDSPLNIGVILLFASDICWSYHAWEHSDLRIEAGFVGCSKDGKIFGNDGILASFGSLG